MRLENKIAIITGSARGLGKAFALRFAREGADLTVCDVHDCAPVAKEIKALGRKALPLTIDISSEKDTAEMAKMTIDHFGRIDILVNNAAVVGGLDIPDFMKPADELTPTDWDRMLGVNVKGTYLCCKAVIRYMKKQKKGNIINIASTAGFYGSKDFLHYSTSKGGIITMTRGLATALGEYNITVNAVAPGVVMTATMQALLPKGAEEHLLDNQIIKRPIQPEDIAAGVVFLASEEANMITGQVLSINAGEYLH